MSVYPNAYTLLAQIQMELMCQRQILCALMEKETIDLTQITNQVQDIHNWLEPGEVPPIDCNCPEINPE